MLGAEGSSDALQICTQHREPIDLLLADLVLPPPGFQLASSMSHEFPHVNGHELALRALQIRSGLRIILMSGNPEKELASHGIKLGTFPFLARPFDGYHLIAIVQHVLSQPASMLATEERPCIANDPPWYG